MGTETEALPEMKLIAKLLFLLIPVETGNIIDVVVNSARLALSVWKPRPWAEASRQIELRHEQEA